MGILKKKEAENAKPIPAFEGEGEGDTVVETDPPSDVGATDEENNEGDTVDNGPVDTPPEDTVATNTDITDVEHKETPRAARVDVVKETPPEPENVVNAKAAAEKLVASAAAKVADASAAKEAARKKPEPETKPEEPEPTPQRALVKKMPTFLTSGKTTPNPLADLKNAFAEQGIVVEYSTFPRLRVDAGIIATPEGKEAGTWIELQVISYNLTWVVTPGVDGDEGKKHVRFSIDGLTVQGASEDDEYDGMTCDDYKHVLKEAGFEKASRKEYLAVYGIALDAEDKAFAHMNEVVSLQLAPQSKGKFESYVLNRTVRARMGKVKETSGNPVLRFTTERVKGKERSYHNIITSDGIMDPVDLS